MNTQKIIIIDGKNITSERDLHLLLKYDLHLPEYYGMNLDALWDCITGYIKLPIKIVWKNFEHSKKTLGEQFANRLVNLFEDANHEFGENFTYELSA